MVRCENGQWTLNEGIWDVGYEFTGELNPKDIDGALRMLSARRALTGSLLIG